MRRLLVTGGAGFIGANFVRRALSTGDDHVTVLDTLGPAANEASVSDLLGPRCTLVRGSVDDLDLVHRLTDGIDVVVHFAAESHNDHALSDPGPSVHTNVVGTYALLQAARTNGFHLHHVSTDEVYGDLALDDPARFTEDSPYRPSSPYSATKAGADLLVRAWVRSYGIRATISNCSNNYGPRQHVEKFIPRQITNILDGRRPELYGDGRNVRDWIHVDDHNDAVAAIIERGESGRTYLIGADGEADNRTVLGTILQLMGRSPDDVDHVPDRPGHDLRYAIDATRLRTELGWTPRHTDLESGLAQTIDWYRANEAWWRPAKDATERFYARRAAELDTTARCITAQGSSSDSR